MNEAGFTARLFDPRTLGGALAGRGLINAQFQGCFSLLIN
jgi:hypothetical protein